MSQPPPIKAARVSNILRFLNFPMKELGGYLFVEDEDFFEGFIYLLILVDKNIIKEYKEVSNGHMKNY